MRKIIIAVLLAMSVPAQAGERLTEAESLRRGLARPELADVARGAVMEAEADEQEAGQWPNPNLEYTRDRTRSSPGTVEKTWQVSQTFDLSGRRGLRAEAGGRKVDATRAGSAAKRAEKAAEIRRRFHEVLLGQEVVRAIASWAQHFEKIEAVVAKLEKAGEASGYDRRRLGRERQAAVARLAGERAGLERGRERLAALIHSQGFDEVTGDLLPPNPPPLETLMAKLGERPDLRAQALKAEAADLENRAAGRGWVPDVTLGAGSRRVYDGAAGESAALLSVSFPLPVFDRQQGAQQRTAAQAMTARAELSLMRAHAEGEVKGGHRQVERLLVAAREYRATALASSASLIRIAETAYQAGETGILELLDAYKGALETETTLLDLEWKAREAAIELDQLTGSHAE